MSCSDCEMVWALNRQLNTWLAEANDRALCWEGEARSARSWANKEASKIIQALRQENNMLKSKLVECNRGN